jgi:hypothetical protein
MAGSARPGPPHPSCLLVVPLQTLGQGVVDDKAHIGLVDAHAKGNGGNNDLEGSVTVNEFRKCESVSRSPQPEQWSTLKACKPGRDRPGQRHAWSPMKGCTAHHVGCSGHQPVSGCLTTSLTNMFDQPVSGCLTTFAEPSPSHQRAGRRGSGCRASKGKEVSQRHRALHKVKTQSEKLVARQGSTQAMGVQAG